MVEVAAILLSVVIGLMGLRRLRARHRLNQRLHSRMRVALAAEAAPVAVRIFADAQAASRPLHPRLVPLSRPED